MLFRNNHATTEDYDYQVQPLAAIVIDNVECVKEQFIKNR